MAVLYAYQAFLAPPDPQKAGQQTAAKGPVNTTTSSSAATSPVVPAGPSPQPVVGETSERQTVVETADVEAVLTNHGGRLLHWRLKRYLDDLGKPVDLVPSALPANQPTPFALALSDPLLTARVNEALFQTSAPARVDATAAAQTVAFE